MTTVVLLHGFTGGPAAWHPVATELPEARCVSPRLLGHGPEPCPSGPQSFDEEVDRLFEQIDAIDGPVHLCGYSLGGRLALGLLCRHASRFSSATLIGARFGLASAEERAARRAADLRWIRMLGDSGIPSFIDQWERVPVFATQTEAQIAAQRPVRLEHTALGLAESLRVTGLAEMPSYRESAWRVTLPVTLVTGERDEKFRRLADELDAFLPNTRRVVVSGAGHNVLVQAPSEIASILRDDVLRGAQ